MHQTQMTLPHPSAIHPSSIHVSAGLPGAGHHFLPSPALASPVGSASNSHPQNAPLTANAPCSTLFVANLGQFVSEHELKDVFSRSTSVESRQDYINRKTAEREYHPFLMTAPT